MPRSDWSVHRPVEEAGAQADFLETLHPWFECAGFIVVVVLVVALHPAVVTRTIPRILMRRSGTIVVALVPVIGIWLQQLLAGNCYSQHY